ncbi:MAG: hypothetical protein M1814_000106 [Vezdaea aestivalis]|nr:MAG: hypothetical protein M1814_000106 [Vezdaea aestivalis]
MADTDPASPSPTEATDITEEGAPSTPPPPTRKEKASAAPPTLPATRFGGAYSSALLSILPEPALPVLTHLNCSYFSTPGVAPTLGELKSHAQALISLISQLDLSASSGGPNDASAFDFLTSLSTPYTNTLATHTSSLATLLNTHHTDPRTSKTPTCPLTHGKPEPQSLVAHTNTLLETLDNLLLPHGGLLSLAPTTAAAAAHSSASHTLLGQWLLYTRALTSRLSELELDVSRMRDILAGEALVPRQTVSHGGPPIAQDSYILAGLDPGVWAHLNNRLNEEEARLNALSAAHAAGLNPSSADEPRDPALPGGERVVVVDAVSRFYRHQGQKGSVFVIPAFGETQGGRGTRVLEGRPLVAVVKDGREGREEGVVAREREERAEREVVVDVLLDKVEALEERVARLRREREEAGRREAEELRRRTEVEAELERLRARVMGRLQGE